MIPDSAMVTVVSKKSNAREKLGRAEQANADLMLRQRNLTLALLLVILFWTILVFVPVLQNDFVNWDDDRNLLENRNYRGLGWEQVQWMLTTFHMTLYRPLTWLSFGLDYLFWGMNPSGYHLTSLLLHAINAIIFYFISVRLLSLTIATSKDGREFYLHLAAGFSALLFALHPLRVEAVAWASARNDVLSGTFYLATILCYLKATAVCSSERSSRLWMTSAVIAYALSLLSKAIGMTLPFVLLLLDFYPLRRLKMGQGPWFGSVSRKVWWEKVPFLLLAACAAITALLAKQRATYSFEEIGLLQRLAQSVWGLMFYLWKTVVPLGLSPLYELSYLDTSGWPSLVSFLLSLALSIGLIVARHRWPAGLASWVFYVIALAPVLGVAQSGPQLVADRYTYLSCLGWALLGGAALCWGWRFLADTDRLSNSAVAGALAAAVLGALSLLTWKQASVWHNSETLWRHALSVEPRSSYAHNNLGNALFEGGNIEEATSHYREALQVNPGHAKAHNNLANSLVNQGKIEEAIVHYREALRIDPANARAHYNLANTMVRQGQLEEAIHHFREAVQNDPSYVKAQYNLGIALAKEGELTEAIEHFGQVLRLDSENAAAHESLARTLALQGKKAQAAHHYQEALRILRSRSEGMGSR